MPPWKLESVQANRKVWLFSALSEGGGDIGATRKYRVESEPLTTLASRGRRIREVGISRSSLSSLTDWALATMKFRIFGGEDAPDWILSGVYTLSKLAPGDIQLLAQEIVRQMLGEAFDYDKALEAVSDPSLDVKACIAALHHLIAGAARFDVDEAAAIKESQQLGLPAELSTAFCSVYEESKSKLLPKLLEQSLRLPALSIAGWQLYKPSSDITLRLIQPCENNESTKGKETYVRVKHPKFQSLLTELKGARSLMEKLSSESK